MARTKGAPIHPTTLSRVMAALGAIKTKKKAASSAKNLIRARAVHAKNQEKIKLDSSNG